MKTVISDYEKFERETYKKFFNIYSKYYINNNPVRVLADFKNIIAGLKKREEEKKQELLYMIQQLTEATLAVHGYTFKLNEEKEEPYLSTIKELSDVLHTLFVDNFRGVRDNYDYDTDQVFRLLINKFGFAIESNPNSSKKIKESFELDIEVFLNIQYCHKKKEQIRLNLLALERMMNRIIDWGYPKSLGNSDHSSQVSQDTAIMSGGNRPQNEAIEQLVRQVAENTTNIKNSNHYDVNTKRSYLVAKIEDPTAKPKKLISKIIEDISSRDKIRLEDKIARGDYRTLNGWVNKLSHALRIFGYTEYAELLTSKVNE